MLSYTVHRVVGTLLLGLVLTYTNAAIAGVAANDTTILQNPTPNRVIEFIKASNKAELETWLEARTEPDRTKFLGIVKTSLEMPKNGYSDDDRGKIEFIASFYDPNGLLFESFLQTNSCAAANGGIATQCTRRADGAAFALWSRENQYPCWKTLYVARGKSKAFTDGVREYYQRQVGGTPQGLDQCEAPAKPTRCKLASCSVDYRSGLAFRPLTDLGVALPLGSPSFGFKAGASGAFQATAGVAARYFVANGSIDLRIGVGISNAVGSDGMTSTAALAWTVQLGLFEMLGIGFLGLTNPENRATGKALVFSVDLAGVRDQIEDRTK